MYQHRHDGASGSASPAPAKMKCIVSSPKADDSSSPVLWAASGMRVSAVAVVLPDVKALGVDVVGTSVGFRVGEVEVGAAVGRGVGSAVGADVVGSRVGASDGLSRQIRMP